MFSDSIRVIPLCLAALAVLSCAMERRLSEISQGGAGVEISIPGDIAEDDDIPEYSVPEAWAPENALQEAGSRDGPLIMNAIKDSETGEMVATDVISASRVVARFRNVAERNGNVLVEFDISVPAGMTDSQWRLKFIPEMDMAGKVSSLEPIYITGKGYREAQLRGYERYMAFLASIITDSSELVHVGQLEKFLMRHFPDTYAMKTDSSFVSDPQAENLFGVSQKQALEHYTRHVLVSRNERRKRNREKMFRRYVKDPVITEGIRLDTVLVSADGDICYRYVQPVRSFPGLRKIIVSLRGEVYRDGEMVHPLARPEDLVFYVSSLSSLVDDTPRYRTKVLQRVVYDNTRAFIDFRKDSADIDTLLEGNSSELARVRKCIAEITSRSEYVLDSMSVTASCSPEGLYSYNASLAGRRAESILEYIRKDFPDSLSGRLRSASVPENWTQFGLLVKSDTVLSEASRKRILALMEKNDKDSVEMSFRTLPEYRYMREKIYPKLRSVKFDFWLHRRDMEKDTVHTSELDTVYMKGVEAIRNMDYKTAVDLLRPYQDYNSALAYLSSGYDESALAVLSGIRDRTYRSNYLMAVTLARLGRRQEAVEFYRRSAEMEPSMVHRANLDPEIAALVRPDAHIMDE